MKDLVKEYVFQNKQQMFDTLKELCSIPAPSHFEQKRAEYCKNWLEGIGAKGVYIDEALNVIFPINCENSNEITVFVAHTDTVFPDMEPMPYFDDGEKIHCPGAADDTASVVVLMMMAKFFVEKNLASKKGIMFVCNSCEEGLGNLKGTRQLFNDYSGRISKFISFDSDLNVIANKCVGSHRYEVEVLTEGGHSFKAFGDDNAIAKLAEIISNIYKIEVPKLADSRTTYNVGTITGGTSVNTIAQNAKLLCEYRSDNRECLDIMKAKFEEIFENARSEKVQVNVKMVGDRPCSFIDDSKIEALEKITVPIIEDVIGDKVSFGSSSTDCNIPLSLGVPALCVGVNMHEKTHTREEWVHKESIVLGLEIAIKLGKALTEV
ncbi:MAG: M20/M25/M40 family metallo-hydrolase [Clostridia bacterium]|nr:M20/M25/M40 family metallo-hydrolase [Clostridia bacterium]